jgi:tyrosyl-tRNA synthetase
MTFQSELLRTLDERGFIHQVTDAEGLDALAAREIVPGYIGFDATAPSLHVGSLVQIMMLRRMQKAGHKPIVLMGGGTSKIGDPSFKDEARKLLTAEAIDANIASIKRVFERFLSFGDGRPTRCCWTMQSGSTGSNISRFCARLGSISRSTGC